MDINEALAPTRVVKVGTALCAMGGLFVALTGLQLVGVRFIDEWMNYANDVFLGAGALIVLLAPKCYRGSLGAALAAVALCLVMSLASAAWFVVTFGSVLSLMNVVAILVAGAGGLVLGVGLSDVRKMALARQRLEDDGLSLGL